MKCSSLLLLLALCTVKISAQEDFNSDLKLAQQGDKGAQNSVGIMYAEGRGVKKDSTEAVKWFQKSAEQGDVPGACNLALHYARGEGIHKDTVLALKWMLVSHSLDGLKCFPDDFVDFLKPSKAQSKRAWELVDTFLISHLELHNEFGERPWLDNNNKQSNKKMKQSHHKHSSRHH